MVDADIETTEHWFAAGAERIRGFAVGAARSLPAPGIVIVPDVHGVSDLYLRVGRRFAAAGFLAFVLDPYSREGAPKLGDMEAVFAWIAALDDRRVLGDIAVAADFVAGLPAVGGHPVGVLGFCLGGQYAFLAACGPARVSAAVSFYGMLRYTTHDEHKPAAPLDVVDRLACPWLGLFGAEDVLIPAADVAELDAGLRRHGKDATIHVYAGAGHAFCNETRPEAWRPEAAADAFARAEAFLYQHLGRA